MRKNYFLIFTLITSLFCGTAKAQMPYNFSYSTDVYVPLTAGTSLNGIHIWDGYTDNYSAAMGFISKIDTARFNTCYLSGQNIMVADSSDTATLNGFFLTDADLIDRGYIAGTSSLSPVRYMVSGTGGNRIFKIEVANAGFHEELNNFSTLNDYINAQLWIYEGSNVIELRYGPSKINNPSTYFNFGGLPMVGLIHNMSPAGDGKLYILSGNPSAPTIDSILLSGGNPTYLGHALNSFPTNGMVYRFTPKTTFIGKLALDDTKVYPTAAQNQVMVDYNSTKTASYKIVSIGGSTTNISGTLQKGTTHIDVTALPAGIYLLQLENDDSRSVKKFVKL